MAMYVSLIQYTDQGIRNIKDTLKRHEAASAEAEKMGVKDDGCLRLGSRVRRAG